MSKNQPGSLARTRTSQASLANDSSTSALKKNRNGSSGAVTATANLKASQSQKGDAISLNNQKGAARNGSLDNNSRGAMVSEANNATDSRPKEGDDEQNRSIKNLEEAKRKL